MNTIEITQLWDERLLNAFGDLINEEGWLTIDWIDFLENNFKECKKKELIGLMYNLDFEESEDGNFIRPTEQKKIDTTPKRKFVVDEEIEHKKYGKGKVKEVFEDKIIILFYERDQPLKFLTYLFEENLL
jgi:hypothetical protein